MSDDNMFYCSFVSIHYIICECGETFPTEEELKCHLERDHALRKERKEFKCGVCESLFDTEEACIKHYENTHLEIKLEHDYVEMEPVEEDSQDGESCEMKYDPHAESVEPNTETNLPQFTEMSELTVISKPRERKPKSYYNIKNIVCEVCGKRYASNAALKYHQRVHTGERPYKCTECPKSFTMPLFLQIHVRTHTGERPYECALCPKAFSNKAALLRHDRVHTGVKPYECPECGKFFTQSNSMKLHVNTVHLKMPAPYKSKTRKNKAKEREMLRNALMRVMDTEETSAVESISETNEPEIFIKPEQGLYQQEVEESEIMYEDVDSREITYEVIYEE